MNDKVEWSMGILTTRLGGMLIIWLWKSITSTKLWYSSRMFERSMGGELEMDDVWAEMSLLTRQRQNSCVPGESQTLL